MAWAAPSVEDDSENVFSTFTEFKVQFDAPVSGVDVSDLVLTGLGGAEATVDSFIDYGVKNVYGFKISGLLPGEVIVDVAPDAGDITYTNGGANVSAKQWTFTVAPGLWLNDSGTGDVALSADFLGLSSTAVTVEVTFLSDEITSGTGAGTTIFAYATDDEPNAFTLFVENDSPNNMKLLVNGAAKTLASGTDVTDALAGAVRSGYALAV